MICLLAALLAASQQDDQRESVRAQMPPVITHWQQLEDELQKLDCRTFSGKEMRRAHLYRHLASTGGLSVYLDMASQGEYPLVALAGFNLVSERYRDNAMQAAVLAVLFAPRWCILAFYDGPLNELAKARDPVAFGTQMAAFMAAARADEVNTGFAVGQLPLRQLHVWFHDDRRITLPARVESIIVERLVVEGPWDQLPITQCLRLALETYAIMPGSPRLRFVFAGDRDHDLFETSLIAVLEETEIDDGLLRLVVRRRRDDIREKIDIKSLKITDERREKISEWLAYEPPPAPASQPRDSEEDAEREGDKPSGDR